MKALIIKEKSVLGNKIQGIEQMMEDAGIRIEGHNLELVVGNTRYKIGRDSDRFPRYVEEPIWRPKE